MREIEVERLTGSEEFKFSPKGKWYECKLIDGKPYYHCDHDTYRGFDCEFVFIGDQMLGAYVPDRIPYKSIDGKMRINIDGVEHLIATRPIVTLCDSIVELL